ncbi:MAG: septum site-determining protein [Streptosporangiales bacterium]|nr:septum site-determining protein [Streptosporangiales bacterium]
MREVHVSTQAAAISVRPLLITADSNLLDDVLRLAAAADVELEVAHAVAVARPSWPAAPLVIVGADLAEDLVRRGPPRRAGVVVVGTEHDEPDIWPLAVALSAEQVVLLPDSETWLVDRLADALEGDAPRAVTMCVLGGRGGAGATVLAASLAVCATRSGRRTLLVDGDPLGGGIDLVLGGEHTAGARWSDFAGTRGRLSCSTLSDALPRVDELTVLSLDRGDTRAIPAEAMRAVLAAAERGTDLVVVDLPRSLDEAAEEALSRATVVLLVVPAEVRATVAASRVVGAVRRCAADVRVVVRGPAPTGLEGQTIAESLGLPLAGRMCAEPDLGAALDRGEPPAVRGKGPLAEFCAWFLAGLWGERERVR